MLRRTAFATLTLASTCVWGQRTPASTPHQIVREAVKNEVRANEVRPVLYRYTLSKQTTSGTSVRDMVETKDGLVARTITWNGRLLTAEERDKEDRKLRRLIESPEEQRKKFKEQKENEVRVMRILQALPTALLYEADGTETMNGRETLRLSFRPNPEYSPSAKELYIMKSAEGMLWIDATERRIVRLAGTLAKDVGIGWGVLGRLDKGGTFLLEQQPVARKQWKLTAMDLDVKGKALLFKTIRIKQKQTGQDFRPVTQMSVAEAVELLRQS